MNLNFVKTYKNETNTPACEEKRALNPLSAKFIKWSNTLKQFVNTQRVNICNMYFCE